MIDVLKNLIFNRSRRPLVEPQGVEIVAGGIISPVAKLDLVVYLVSVDFRVPLRLDGRWAITPVIDSKNRRKTCPCL